jgi:hypothetical protein
MQLLVVLSGTIPESENRAEPSPLSDSFTLPASSRLPPAPVVAV